MKKLSYLFIILLVSIAGFAQTDTSLIRRLKEYTRFSKELNFEGLMEYMHPSLFELAPKDQLIEVFKNVYENDATKMTIEKLENRSISDPFTLKGVKYCKVDYDMEMHLMFKDESRLSDTTLVSSMLSTLKQALIGKDVSYNASRKIFIIKGSDVLIAIKEDPKTPWLFLGYDGTNELVKKLFPEELIEHFKLQ
jgi:hypothetical protein